MPMYLHQANYSSDAMRGLVAKPQNRKEIVSKAFSAAGGRLVDAWMAFGEYDVIVISEFSNDVDVAALAMTISASGALNNMKTTVLISMDDAVNAMQKASDMAGSYRTPSE